MPAAPDPVALPGAGDVRRSARVRRDPDVVRYGMGRAPGGLRAGWRTWVVFGAYDYNFHFLDAATGHRSCRPFPTGDIAKGTVTVDPRLPPRLRRLAGQQAARAGHRSSGGGRAVGPRLHGPALQPRLWNSDWDAAPLIIGDYLVTGGENSRFHVVKLNRSYGADGLVQVAPELVFTAPAWDDELLANLPDTACRWRTPSPWSATRPTSRTRVGSCRGGT